MTNLIALLRSCVLLLMLPAAFAKCRVLCIGETLFDGLPGGIYLGGAPLNAAVHLAELGVEATFASAVGKDRLGREAIRRLTARGVDTSLVRTVEDFETGFVEVDVDPAGDASYTFATPAAWDHVSCDGISEAAAAADAVVFGTLGCRAPATRAAVRAAAAAARYSVCDVNLRPPFVDEAIVAEAASGVDLLKLNDEELLPLAKALRSQADGDDDDVLAADAAYEAALRVDGQEAADDDDDDSGASTALIAEAAAAIGKAARASSVVVTRGAAGAVVWESGAGNAWSCGGFSPPTVVDTVGAGDSFLAALLASLLINGEELPDALEVGCRCGAFVASCAGATPEHDAAVMASLEACVAGGPSQVEIGEP